MTPVSIYGAIVSDNAVELGLLRALQGWLPSYLTEVARQEGNGAVAMPASWQTTRDRVTTWKEQQIPAVVAQVGGTVRITRRGSFYRVVYGATIGAVVVGPTRDDTRRLAGVYGIAIPAALVQHGDLRSSAFPDGLSDGVEWTDTDYTYIGEERSRTLMAAVISLDVAVNAVLDVAQGPAGGAPDPDDAPISGLPDWGEADEVITDQTLVPINEEFT